MAVVLLTNNSNRAETLAHLIVNAGLDLRLVVVETGLPTSATENPIKTALRPIIGRPYQWLRSRFTLSKEDRAALTFESESIERANQLVDKYISSLNFSGRPENIQYLECPTLNHATVITAVKQSEPDVCVVLGTSILKPVFIAIPKIGTINAHTSILPEYRGSRSEFWQCYNQHYDYVGITLHLIDKGVDTGSILFQKRQVVGKNPDPNLLRARNTMAILDNYVPVLKSVLDGTAKPAVQGKGTTPTYKFRDITLEKRLKLYKRIMAKNG